MSQLTLTLSVLLLREGNGEDGGWVAQCLEYDIAAQGKTINAAKQALERTIVGQVVVDVAHGGPVFCGVQRAPKHIWDKFVGAERLSDRQPMRFPDTVPSQISATAEDLRVYA